MLGSKKGIRLAKVHESFLEEIDNLTKDLKSLGLTNLSICQKSKIAASIIKEVRPNLNLTPLMVRKKVKGVNVKIKL